MAEEKRSALGQTVDLLAKLDAAGWRQTALRGEGHVAYEPDRQRLTLTVAWTVELDHSPQP